MVRRPDESTRPIRRTAFTLAELAVVVLILALLSGIAVPRYGSFLAGRRVEATARRILVDLSLAQRRAKFTTTSQTLSFSVVDSTYTIVDMPDPDHADTDYVVSLAEEPYQATIVSADFNGDTEIIFDGYGMPDSGGTVVVQVGDYQETITIAADEDFSSIEKILHDPVAK